MNQQADSQLSGKREWAHELSVGIAAVLNLFDPPEVVDEAILARALREVASESSDLGQSLFLRALADSFDHPKALQKLTLSRGRRGRPTDERKVQRALGIGRFIEVLVRQGWKKEAAVQQVMSKLQLSRAAVLRSCSEYNRLHPLQRIMEAPRRPPQSIKS